MPYPDDEIPQLAMQCCADQTPVASTQRRERHLDELQTRRTDTGTDADGDEASESASDILTEVEDGMVRQDILAVLTRLATRRRGERRDVEELFGTTQGVFDNPKPT